MEEIDEPLADQPKWLNQIQSRSWEAELLISGGAVLTLFQFTEYLRELTARVDFINYHLGEPLVIIQVGVRLLTLYFSFHLLARTFWLSLVFLQKIYPEGVKIEKFSFAEPFRSLSGKFNISVRIAKLDKYCSFIFSWAVTILFLCLGYAIALIFIYLIKVFFLKFFPETIKIRPFPPDYYIRHFFFDSLLVFYLDSFFHGILRRSKVLGRIYYPFYIFWNMVSLGFLWRPSFQVIFSNVKDKWKASLLIIFLTVTTSFLFLGSSGDHLGRMDYRKYKTAPIEIVDVDYADKISENEWSGSTIQSDIIKEGYLKVFVPYSIEADEALDSLKTTDKYLSNIFSVSLDDSICTDVKWVGVYKINRQSGINTVVGISHLKEGLHILKIKNTSKEDSGESIPFWKQ